MRQILSSANFSSKEDQGFTLLEVLVALSLCSIIGALITQTLVLQSDTYLTDLGRVRIQQNLRSSLDIVATNIRQSGEGLNKYFPALTLASGNTLTTRRKILHEVLTACQPIAAGVSQIFVSDGDSVETECLPANISSSFNAWSAYRSSKSDPIRIYIYDRVSKTGEFVDYSAESTSNGSHYLTVSAVQHAYPMRSTNLYIIEEYAFSLDSQTNTLKLRIDGDTSTSQDVAYHVTDFSATIGMQDGSTRTDFNASDSKTWKDLQYVSIGLSGEESWKQKKVVRTINGKFFLGM